MENRKYEEEYSLLEIAKYNLKHWVILLICALAVGLVAGAYGYKNTQPSVVHYEELQQANGAFSSASIMMQVSQSVCTICSRSP